MEKQGRSFTWGFLTLFLLALALFTVGCHKEEKSEGTSTYYEGKDFSRPGSAKTVKTGGQ